MTSNNMRPHGKDYNKTKFLTGIRAYSVLAIFLTHTGGSFLSPISPLFAKTVVHSGKYFVVSFFVISAFSIYMSLDRRGKFDARSYIGRRLLRILPLYFVMLTIAFFLGGSEYYLQLFSIGNDLKNFIYHVSFLNLFDLRYRNSLIGVEWIIPIELFYYILIPIIFLIVRRISAIFVLLLPVSLIVSIYFSYNVPFYYISNNPVITSHWSVEKYFFSFMLGVFTYLILKEARKRKLKFRFGSLILVMHFSLLILWLSLQTPIPELFMATWISALIIFCSSQNYLTRLLFENKTVQYLGTISFSFYLTHLVILGYLHRFPPLYIFIIGLTLTVVISSITYYILERPFLVLSKNFLNK